jgi:DNA-binding transcriptional ArsR family regulator
MRKIGPGVSNEDLDQLTSVFQLLSDQTRLKILLLLAQGERNVTTLCGDLALPQPTVSHHLGLLRIRNVIGHRRQGKQVFYALNGMVNLLGEQGIQLGLENTTVTIGPRR